MANCVKLPNGNVMGVDENGFITTKVEVELSELIGNDLETLLALLSERATGSGLLSNISYSVAGHCGDTIDITVTGSIEMIEDVEEMDIEALPMIEFEVEVTRIGYGSRTIRLSARTKEEALHIADDDAGNHSYNEHTSDYEFDVRQVG